MTVIRTLFALILLGTLSAESSSGESSFCERFDSQLEKEISIKEQSVISRICHADIDDSSGMVIEIGKYRVPFPNEFYVVADQLQFLVAFSSLETSLRFPGWPYLTAGISRGSPFDSMEPDRISETRLPAPVFADTCEASIELRMLELSPFHSENIQKASEARFDGYSIIIFGQSANLIRAIMDTFVRINCRS